MRKLLVSSVASMAVLGAFMLVLQSLGVAQAPDNSKAKAGKAAKAGGRAARGPSGPAPHFADGTSDLSGVWMGGGGLTPKAGEQIVMLPWAEKVFKERKSSDDPEANCLPAGIPRMAPYPWRMVQTPTHYFMLFEGNIHSYRQIFMNAKHPADPDPTWYGHSVGHWEGDTLVIDTIGFNDKFWFDFLGHPHTEQLHTIERMTRTDLGNLAVEVTIDDPGAYAKPFTIAAQARLMPNAELLEYICQENNTNVKHIVGPARNP